jgi:hypothetical protein
LDKLAKEQELKSRPLPSRPLPPTYDTVPPEPQATKTIYGSMPTNPEAGAMPTTPSPQQAGVATRRSPPITTAKTQAGVSSHYGAMPRGVTDPLETSLATVAVNRLPEILTKLNSNLNLAFKSEYSFVNARVDKDKNGDIKITLEVKDKDNKTLKVEREFTSNPNPVAGKGTRETLESLRKLVDSAQPPRKPTLQSNNK